MRVLAIDPGNTRSAYVLYAERSISAKGIVENAEMLRILDALGGAADECVIEMTYGFGARVWKQVYETVFWTGRFAERWESRGRRARLVERREVKRVICGSSATKDRDVRQALILRFGPDVEEAIGTKKAPGPLYGVRADEWAALALAVAFTARREKLA